MATNYSYIKGPSDFVYGDDFEMFWERFQAFIMAAKCAKEAQYSLFLSYNLDDVSFRRVQVLTFTADHKTGENVDLTKAHLLIKGALSKEPDVPARITLRYKIQGLAENVTEFGDAIRLLGQKIFGTETDGNAMVIESFCAGLYDANLASKMVQKDFKSLSEAIKYAVSRNELTNIKNVLVEQRGKSTE